MKNFKAIAFFLLLVTLSNLQVVYGQINPDDIDLVENEIENNFYEALKQRGIENYDKAIIAIQKCIQKDNTNPVFYHELGKNFLDLKQYLEAENAFKKAIELNSNERWYLNSLYDVYYQTKDFLKSIPVVQKLISFDPNMSEDLVSLYMYTNQHDKALNLLNEMESTSVLSQSMEYYKLNQFGDLVPTDDIENGIPTKGYYAFEMYDISESWQTRYPWGYYRLSPTPGIRVPSSVNGDPFTGGWEGTTTGLFEYDIINRKRKFYTIKTKYNKHKNTNVSISGDHVNYLPQTNEFKDIPWNFPVDRRDIPQITNVEVIGSVIIPKYEFDVDINVFDWNRLNDKNYKTFCGT